MVKGRETEDLREKPQKTPERGDLASRRDDLTAISGVEATCKALFSEFNDLLDDQRSRNDDTLAHWNLYNCKRDGSEFYSGTNELYAPLVHDAVEARRIRYLNELFPRSGKWIEAAAGDGTRPSEMLSLLGAYARRARLHTEVVPVLLKNGDLEGQYTVYVSWGRIERNVVHRSQESFDELGIEVEEIAEEVELDEGPLVEVIADADILVFPLAADGLEDALAQGGGVCIMRRWTKAKLAQLIEDGEIEKEAGVEALALFGSGGSVEDEASGEAEAADEDDPAEKHIDAAGLQRGARGPHLLVYEIWARFSVEGEKRLGRVYMAGADRILSVRRNPYWCDLLPVLSVPKDKVGGSIKGRAPVAVVKDFQVLANDALNMGMDSVPYSINPITLTDPDKNPNTDAMVSRPGAVWLSSPRDTNQLVVPPLWQQGLEVMGVARAQIERTLAVTAAMVPQQASAKKLNQAEIAAEQQTALITTADASVVLEEGILTPMLRLFVAFDHQFRDQEVTVPRMGAFGGDEGLIRVPPQQYQAQRYHFFWFGTESIQNEQRVQQQIATLNVVRGIPPTFYPNHRLDLSLAIAQLLENAFGPRLAPKIFQNIAELPPDQQLQAMAEKMGGVPGAPGPAGPGTGAPGMVSPGGPRVGAVPGMPTGGQAPPGAVHRDAMHGPGVMPRRAG